MMQSNRPPVSPHRPHGKMRTTDVPPFSVSSAAEAPTPAVTLAVTLDISAMIPVLPFAVPAPAKEHFLQVFNQWRSFCSLRNIALEHQSDSIKVHYACCIYLVLKAEADAGKPVDDISIGALLRGLEVNVFLFFRVVTQMFQSAGQEQWFRAIFADNGGKVEKEFKQLEAHFIILVILFAKYRKVYADVCSLTEGEMEAIVKGGGAALHRGVFTTCWKLFLHSVEQEGCFDMIPGFYLLLASLHIAITDAPRAIRQSALAKLPAVGPAGATTLLARICQSVSGKVDDAEKALEKVTAIVKTLSASGALVSPVFAGDNLEANKANLDAILAPVKASLTAVDGCLMLDNMSLVSTSSASPQVVRQQAPSTASSDRDRAMSPPPSAVHASPSAPPPVFRTPERAASHMRPVMPGTPISTNLNDASWLAWYLEAEATTPDAVLVAYFEACDAEHNPRAAIEHRCTEFPRRLELGQPLVDSGLKLYYKSLRLIVRKEEERLRKKNFTDMLNDDAMHRALLAICFEIVVHVHLRLSKPFPAVSQALDVCEFELLVMIENFLRDFEASLSREVRRHIIQLLTKIVDCNAWKSASPLLAHLADEDNMRHFASVIEGCTSGLASHVSSTVAKEAPHASRAPPESPLLVRASMLPPRHPISGVGKTLPFPPLPPLALQAPQEAAPKDGPVAHPDPAASSSSSSASNASALRRQVHKQLAAFGRRLWFRTMDVLAELYKYLRNSAGMSHASYERCAHVLARLLAEAGPRSLLHDRHLHQVVMCVVFGACKVEGDAEVTFKRIIAEHRFAFDTGEQIYWVVRMGASDDQTGNLIEFYNKVFILSSKDYLLEEVPAYIATMLGDSSELLGSQRLPPASPLGGRRSLVARTPPASPSTPRRFVRANVAVSPMRSEQRNQMHMTPRTSRLWTFEQNSIGDICSDATTLGKRHAESISGGVVADRARKLTALEEHARRNVPPMPPSDLLGKFNDATEIPTEQSFAVPPRAPTSPALRHAKEPSEKQ